MTDLEISIIPADDRHAHFCLKAFFLGASYQNKKYFQDPESWNNSATELFRDLLIRGATLSIAVAADDPDTYLGFIFWENIGGKKVLHWVYTTKIYRNQGLMKSLLLSAGFDLTNNVIISIPSPFNILYREKPYFPILRREYLPESGRNI